MPGLARKSGWNAARTELFDFSVHYSNSAVCRYTVLSYKRFVYTAGLLCACKAATRAGSGACQSYCNAQRNQTALFWQHSCLNFEPNLAFWANYIIITCFPSLLPSLLLIESNIFRPSLFHSLLHCYYHIIIMASLFSLSRLSLCDY